jgi:hypothetical protein
MLLPPERPFVLVCCFAMFQAASVIVPARKAWLAEWQFRTHSRWQFLQETGLWNKREAVRLFFFAALSVMDALRQVAAQEEVQQKLRVLIQSPASCLVVLSGILAAIILCSGGAPATRDLFFKRLDNGNGRLAYVWLHTMRHGGDHPLPSDVIGAWNEHGTRVRGAAGFRASHLPVVLPGGERARPLVILTEPKFFEIMRLRPAIGAVPGVPGLVLSYAAWSTLFHGDPRVIGSHVAVDKKSYPVMAVLPAKTEPLTRQPAIYLVSPRIERDDLFAVVRVKQGVSARQLESELGKVAEEITYYFLQGQLRVSFAQPAILAPLWSFAASALASGLLLMLVFRMNWRVFQPFTRQAGFFYAKTLLALACVFSACLEWSRSSSAILFGTFDPASGPFLLWLYIMGTMGVFFWTVMDQRARCRECLRLLAFPVRIGSPGTFLLDWSGTEFCCSEGHGVLHVPHMAPSWSEESDHWITLDDSWQSLFQHVDKKHLR